MYFNVDFVFFKLIKVHLLVSELYMHLLSLARLPVCSYTFKNLKTIERVLGNVILNVTRICRKRPVWVKIEH